MGCDFWMDAQREAPEKLSKANERISQLEAQVTKLEAELAAEKRRAAWYLDVFVCYCDVCAYDKTDANEEPCKSCIYHTGVEKNFSPAPVPENFEVKE